MPPFDSPSSPHGAPSRGTTKSALGVVARAPGLHFLHQRATQGEPALRDLEICDTSSHSTAPQTVTSTSLASVARAVSKTPRLLHAARTPRLGNPRVCKKCHGQISEYCTKNWGPRPPRQNSCPAIPRSPHAPAPTRANQNSPLRVGQGSSALGDSRRPPSPPSILHLSFITPNSYSSPPLTEHFP
jgi:hypothetical protein